MSINIKEANSVDPGVALELENPRVQALMVIGIQEEVRKLEEQGNLIAVQLELGNFSYTPEDLQTKEVTGVLVRDSEDIIITFSFATESTEYVYVYNFVDTDTMTTDWETVQQRINAGTFTLAAEIHNYLKVNGIIGFSEQKAISYISDLDQENLLGPIKDQATPSLEDETLFPMPKVESLDYTLNPGTHAYLVARIDVGFGVPTHNWNLVENSDQIGLHNNPSRMAHMLVIQESQALTRRQVTQELEAKGCTNIEVSFVPVSFVTQEGKSSNGYYACAHASMP